MITKSSFFLLHYLAELDQLQEAFRKLSIRSLLLDKYRQFLLKSNHEFTHRLFINECRVFLHDYGCLLDRHTYKILKENCLHELEHTTQTNHERMIQLATQVIQLIKPIIELRVKQKHHSFSSIPIDVFRKLNLEPIEELANENETKKMTTSVSTTQIYGNFPTTKSGRITSAFLSRYASNVLLVNHLRPSRMTTSKTCHSNFLVDSPSQNPSSDDYDYIDDDYSTLPTVPITDPLVKCYHRHIREHISTMFTRYSRLSQIHSTPIDLNNSSLLITEGKALIVAGHKLVFVLETLHEHLRHSTKVLTPLVHLTRQLCDALTTFVRLLKQLSNQTSINTQNFQHDTHMIMNIVKRIKQQCTSV